MERPSQAPPAALEGTSSGVRFEILGRLAVGGMAELYTARAVHRDGRTEHVVLKRILPHLAQDPDFVRMFRDEAHLAATLLHDNIVRVHDIGHDGDDYFFTMEYVHGENCRTIIRAAQEAEAHVPLEHIVAIGMGVTAGLHYAHEHHDADGNWLRIVHRDVSPTNILVSFAGEVKIVDFGIAKAAAATHITQAGMLKGKASYMSPEQCRADPVDRRSDVFTIGILLYEMTTLTRLFRGDNELVILHQILTGNFEPPSQRIPGYPADLETIVVKCLQSAPEERYQTAQEIHDDLRSFAQRAGLHVSAAGLGQYLLDLCGDKAYPWSPEGAEELAETATETTTTGQSSAGFDEQDTRVNLSSEPKTPAPRPGAADDAIPGPPPASPPAVAAASPTAEPGRPEPVDPRASTGKQRSLGGPPARPAAAAAKPKARAPSQRPSRSASGSSPSASSGSRSATSSGSRRAVPRPRKSNPSGVAARIASLGKPSAPPLARPTKSSSGGGMAKPSAPALKRPRGPGRVAARQGPLTARQGGPVPPPGSGPTEAAGPGGLASGRTLSGTPQPAQSRQTVIGDASPSAPPSARPTEFPTPAAAPPAATVPAPSRSSEERATVAPLTPPPKVDKTMLMPSPDEEDLRATIPGTTLPVSGPIGVPPSQSGPMAWGADPRRKRPADPLNVTQEAPSGPYPSPPAPFDPSASGPALAATQPAPPRAASASSSGESAGLMRTQQSPGPAADKLLVTQRAPLSGVDVALPELEPVRRKGIPVWIPIVAVLVVAAAAVTAILMWWPASAATTEPSDDPAPSDAAGETPPPKAEAPASDAAAKADEPAAPDDDPPAEPADETPTPAAAADVPDADHADSEDADTESAPAAADDDDADAPPTPSDAPAKPHRASKPTPPAPEPKLPTFRPGRPVPP